MSNPRVSWPCTSVSTARNPGRGLFFVSRGSCACDRRGACRCRHAITKRPSRRGGGRSSPRRSADSYHLNTSLRTKIPMSGSTTTMRMNSIMTRPPRLLGHHLAGSALTRGLVLAEEPLFERPGSQSAYRPLPQRAERIRISRTSARAAGSPHRRDRHGRTAGS
jgi:hypothetical protein